jgi:hypothetical protein
VTALSGDGGNRFVDFKQTARSCCGGVSACRGAWER